MKLVLFTCSAHDDSVCEINGEVVWSNGYDYENVLRLAGHLGWEVELISLDENEFEERFA